MKLLLQTLPSFYIYTRVICLHYSFLIIVNPINRIVSLRWSSKVIVLLIFMISTPLSCFIQFQKPIPYCNYRNKEFCLSLIKSGPFSKKLECHWFFKEISTHSLLILYLEWSNLSTIKDNFGCVKYLLLFSFLQDLPNSLSI